MYRALVTFVALLLITAVAWPGPPKPVESEWLVTESGTFFIDGDTRGRDGALCFHMEFRVRKPVTETLYVTVDFENPEDKDSPLFSEFEIAPGTTIFEAKSEMIHAIRNRSRYRVKVWIYADVKRKELLGTHEQLVQFDMPRELLERFGIRLL
jgi:hypothetical protein